MNKKPNQYIILDPETSEIIGRMDEGDTIYRSESRKEFKDKKQKEKSRAFDVKNRGNFLRLLHNAEKEIEKEMTLNQCSVLLDLFLTITKDSNYIVHTKGNTMGKKMNTKEIALYLGKSEPQTKKVLKELVEVGALNTEINPKNKREKFYLLNSEFFTVTKSKGTKLKFTKLFHNKLREVLSNLETNNHRGALLKFIRNFHYQTYYLVSNPDHNIIINPDLSVADNLLLEENETVLQHLNQKQLASIIGINENLVKSYVSAFEKAGALMVQKQNKNYRFIVHPDLMFRRDSDGEDEYTKTIRFQFKQLESKIKKSTKKKQK